MDINNIKKLVNGQIVKNYREMCKLLGEEIKKGGKSKILQLKDWERYFSFKREKQKFIIVTVYKEPKPKIDKRQNGNNNNNIYGEIVQKLLMNMLINNNGKLSAPISYYLIELCMTNQNYSHYQYNQKELAEILDIDKFSVDYFYLTSKNNFRGIFERALKNLVKKQYIMWEKVMMIKSGYNYKVATQEEQRVIHEAEEKALKDMGYKNVQKINLAGKYKKYQEKLMEIIEKKIEIDYFYYNYLIRMELVNNEDIQTDMDLLKLEMNNLIIENLVKQAKERHSMTLKKYELLIGNPRKPRNQFDLCKIDDDYVDINIKLISILVNKDTEYIGSLDIAKKVKKAREISGNNLEKLSLLTA